MAGQRVCTGAFLLAVTLGCLVHSSQGVTLNVQNQCTDAITVYWQSKGLPDPPNTAVVQSGGQTPVDVGASWPEGGMWAGNPSRALATLAELNIAENAADTIDISVVNAYNLGLEITPVTPSAPSGATCDDIKCTIAGLEGFCDQGSDNVYTPASGGNSESCTNTDGPQPQEPECCCPTDNTRLFKGACPDAYSFSADDQSSTFTCGPDPTDYNIIFCPAENSSNHGFTCPQTSRPFMPL